MAIRDESTGTDELLLDSRYHIASLTGDSDPDVGALIPAIKDADAGLRKARDASEGKKLTRIEKQALFDRAEGALDRYVRKVDLEVLAALDNKRTHDSYKAVFPRGAAAIIALQGTEEAAAIEGVIKGLKGAKELGEVAKRHADTLKKLAAASAEAEKGLITAEAEADQAYAAEVAARRVLVRQLQKNEGALLAIYPGQRAQVRGYFRAIKRRPTEDPAEPAPAPSP